MPDQFENIDFVLSIVFTLLAFFVLLVTIVVLMYFSRKKLLAQQLKNKDLQIQNQQEVLNATIDAQEQERGRIARDLHDDIGSKLNVITMNVRLLELDDLEKTERKEIAKDTLQACQLLIESTRQISHNLVPPVLDKIGLHMALDEMCGDFSSSGAVRIVYTNRAEQAFFQHLSMEKQVHLFRIVQELINNSIKHGKASEIRIEIDEVNGCKTMIYTDNGTGITHKKIQTSKGIGLRNIISRSKIIQAEAFFDTDYNKGFRFTLIF